MLGNHRRQGGWGLGSGGASRRGGGEAAGAARGSNDFDMEHLKRRLRLQALKAIN